MSLPPDEFYIPEADWKDLYSEFITGRYIVEDGPDALELTRQGTVQMLLDLLCNTLQNKRSIDSLKARLAELEKKLDLAKTPVIPGCRDVEV